VCFFLKTKQSNSVFWEYVFVCAAVALISCVITGFLLGSIYLRSINARNEQMLQDQSVHAVQELDSQLDSMHQLSIQLSVQRIYRADHILAHKYNVLTAAQSITQYQSYCPMSSQFVLVYQNGSETLLLQKDGTTTDLTVFLQRHLAEDTAELRAFLLSHHESGSVLRAANALIFSFPLRSNNQSEASLFFVVPLANLQERIRLSSSLPEGSYRLVYQGMELISHNADTTVSSNAAGAFRIDAEVPHLSIQSLMASPKDILLLALCLLLLFASIFTLAWRCYRPIRSLSLKHSGGTTTDIKNELLLLDQVITQTRDRSLLLDQKASDQSALLQDYVLLMLLNNSGTATILQDLSNAGIDLPHSHFAVITMTPCKDQLITQENIDILLENVGDITGDIGVMYAVECSHASHTLAIVCNPETPELYDVLVQRLYTYLSAQSRRFLVGTGPLTDRLAGISASYLTALSHLRQLANAQAESIPVTLEDTEDTGSLIKRIISHIERGDCPQALVTLETFMSVIERHQSELIRRYSVLNINMAIQQLCSQLNFRLTDEQMTILLSMRSVQTIHFALLQIIPTLCIQAQKQSSEAILPTGKLIMEYLRNHCCEYNITVQQVAEAVGIGINRASALIREETGHSFKTTLTSLRMEKAKTLLAAGVSVAEAAERTGYNSASYFIKVFKSAVGTTPDAYRRSRYSGAAGEEAPEETFTDEDVSSDEE
jgi:AraC-like DNA-binding protein